MCLMSASWAEPGRSNSQTQETHLEHCKRKKRCFIKSVLQSQSPHLIVSFFVCFNASSSQAPLIPWFSDAVRWIIDLMKFIRISEVLSKFNILFSSMVEAKVWTPNSNTYKSQRKQAQQYLSQLYLTPFVFLPLDLLKWRDFNSTSITQIPLFVDILILFVSSDRSSHYFLITQNSKLWRNHRWSHAAVVFTSRCSLYYNAFLVLIYLCKRISLMLFF